MAKGQTADGYIRVSRRAGREGESFISPELQRKKIADWATLHEVEILAWWEEIDQSGAKLERPMFQQALARCEEGETGGIVVAKLDRFARSAVDALGAIRRLNETGARLVSVEDNFDGSTPMGRFAIGILTLIAELELERIKENWSAESVLEVQVPDIAGVVVARHADDQRARQGGELLLGERVLVGVALVGEVAGDDDEVGRGRVDLLDCGAEKLLAIAAAADVDVGELRDQHGHSLTRPQWPRPPGLERHSPRARASAGWNARHARAGSGTGVPRRDFDYLPKGAARSPSSEARVRTSGFRPARFGRTTAGIVTASGTLTLREAAYEEPFKGRQGDGDTDADEMRRVPHRRTDRDGCRGRRISAPSL